MLREHISTVYGMGCFAYFQINAGADNKELITSTESLSKSSAMSLFIFTVLGKRGAKKEMLLLLILLLNIRKRNTRSTGPGRHQKSESEIL